MDNFSLSALTENIKVTLASLTLVELNDVIENLCDSARELLTGQSHY
jgi:hypothetical protein